MGGGWGGGSFRATKESTETEVQGAKWRDSRTEDRCQPARSSLRGLSAHLPGWVGAESWDSGFGGQIPGRGLGLAAWRQPEVASAPQLAGMEARKNSGPAGEARDLCFRVHEERGFLPSVPTKGRAPSKQAPEMGVSCSYQLGHQRRAWNAKASAAATKNPVCNCRSQFTLSQEPVQHATARVPWSRDNFPGRTHGAPQAVAMSRQPLLPQAHPAFQFDYHTPPSPWP